MSQQTTIRLLQAKMHFTHYSHIFGNLQVTGIPLLDSYLLTTLLTILFATFFYFTVSSLSYLLFFKWKKQKYTPFQGKLKEYEERKAYDIKWSLINIFGQSPLVAAIHVAYPYLSKIQYDFQWRPAMLFYIIFHFVYDQFFTYWAHRLLHHPVLYRKFHIYHHKSFSVTPYSGFAFHPLDAFAQAVPVFTSCFFVPLPIDFVILHGLVTSFWAISIHDNVNLIPFKGILYAGSHSIHHFPWGQKYNFGKITSVCDRFYGSYCDPEGITGYGYQPNAFIANSCNILNKLYAKIVPDQGKQKVEGQSRKYILNQRNQLMRQLQSSSTK